MKARVKCSTRSSTSTKREESSFCRYLKPGALAQLRDSKITAARFKMIDSEAQIALYQLKSSTTTTLSSQSPPTQNTEMIEQRLISFPFRISRTRCLQRKKLSAIAPVFSLPQS